MKMSKLSKVKLFAAELLHKKKGNLNDCILPYYFINNKEFLI